ncbi:MAG: radical SAM family heme chaperone HemW [Cyclobacteriaceae bacterium]
MAGIYIHIPYCKQACHYCDFHFSTHLKTKPQLLKALLNEIEIQADYLFNNPIDSIYFGGGTPSILSPEELDKIFQSINKHHNISEGAEVTLEANPDDLSKKKLRSLYSLGVNRLSIGIQSFDDKILTLFNRAHNARMATDSVKNARDIGFENISVDLIFGLPDQTVDHFQTDLMKIIDLETEHVSIYGLTIEEKTVFGKWSKSKKINLPNEEVSAQQFELIMDGLSSAGFDQYEISNFCRKGYESKHNSSYWDQKPYLGIGPGAHSYNGNSRQFNIPNNANYIKSISKGELPCDIEHLSALDKYNEYILTKLRTKQGVDIDYMLTYFSQDLLTNRKTKIEQFEENGLVEIDNYLRLTRKGRLIADSITESLIEV